MDDQNQGSLPPYSPPNSSMAIISLIAGITGVTIFPLLGSVIALITGYMARNEIRDSRGTIGGEGLATAGLILGWIGVGLAVIGVCVFGFLIVVPFCLALFAMSTEQGLLPALLTFL